MLSGVAYATVWYVHPDSALNSIRAAMDSCSSDDTVLVGPGIYSETIWWPDTQGIDLISECGPDVTVIDGSSGGGAIVIYLTNNASLDSTTRIVGFSIQNGSDFGIRGQNYSAVITENRFINNASANGFFGVIDCDRGSPVITGNVFRNNVGFDFKGAIACRCDSFDTPYINDNMILNNPGYSGIHVFSDHDAVPMSRAVITDNIIIGCGLCGILCWYPSCIKHNDIIGNTQYGISVARCRTTDIDSCTIAYNIQHGIWKGQTPGDSVTVFHCNIEDNFGYGINNTDSTTIVHAKDNWWGHASGPYHPYSNPSGLGDSVSDWVDFTPWLELPVGVKEDESLLSHTPFISVSPNPFRYAAKIECQITDECELEMRIFDVSGRTVRRLGCQTLRLSNHLTWDGTDDCGKKLPSGVYFLTIKAGEHRETTKLLLVR